MKKTLFFALLLMSSTGMVKAQSVTGDLGNDGADLTHNDQFFTGKAVTVDLSTGGTVKLTATTGYGGENQYDVSGEALALLLDDAAVEPVQVINPEGAEATYNVGSHVASNDLNFNGVENGMTAYVATAVDGTKGKVTLKIAEGNAIRSGHAFVMRAEEKGWYCIPVGGSAGYTTNMFLGVTKGTPVGDIPELSTTSTYYALHKSGVFAKINVGEGEGKVKKVPAGRAYLEIAGSAQSTSLELVFDGEETAIDAVNANGNGNVNVNVDSAYNTLGQRVNANGKGLIITKGKKFINND